MTLLGRDVRVQMQLCTSAIGADAIVDYLRPFILRDQLFDLDLHHEEAQSIHNACLACESCINAGKYGEDV